MQKMREDKKFREIMQNIGDREKLWDTIKDKGFELDKRGLMQAVTACLAELQASGV